MEGKTEPALSDGEISTTESLSSQSNNSEIITDIRNPPSNNILRAVQSQNLQTFHSATNLNVNKENGARGTAISWGRESSDSGSTGATQEIKDLLCEFHSKISDKIENSQISMRDNLEQSQAKMREGIITEFRGLMTTEVLNPLKNSIDQANANINRIEQEHLAKITENATKIDTAQEQLQLKITSIEQRLAQNTTPEISQSRHSFNPGLLSRLNNIVITGVKEHTDENLQSLIKDIAKALDCQIESLKAKRLGKKNENITRPRQILVQLGSHWDRKKLYAARSKLNGYEDTDGNKPYDKVFFNEDLDKLQASLFYKGRQAKKSGLIKSIWTYGCQVYFSKLGSEVPIALTAENQLPKLPAQATQMAAALPTANPQVQQTAPSTAPQ